MLDPGPQSGSLAFASMRTLEGGDVSGPWALDVALLLALALSAGCHSSDTGAQAKGTSGTRPVGADCLAHACPAGQICVESTAGGKLTSTTCAENPCGREPLDCRCAKTLCAAGALCRTSGGKVLCGSR